MRGRSEFERCFLTRRRGDAEENAEKTLEKAKDKRARRKRRKRAQV